MSVRVGVGGSQSPDAINVIAPSVTDPAAVSSAPAAVPEAPAIPPPPPEPRHLYKVVVQDTSNSGLTTKYVWLTNAEATTLKTKMTGYQTHGIIYSFSVTVLVNFPDIVADFDTYIDSVRAKARRKANELIALAAA